MTRASGKGRMERASLRRKVRLDASLRGVTALKTTRSNPEAPGSE